MVLDAIAVVFGPPFAVVTIFDFVFWRYKVNLKGRSKMALRGGLSFGSDLWVFYALDSADQWGVNESNLDILRRTFESVKGLIPDFIEELLPSEVILFLVILVVMYYALYA